MHFGKPHIPVRSQNDAMHHRAGSRNWVESDKNLRNVGWLGCQDGFVNLDDVGTAALL
jgi:hypothetical protein